MKGELKFNAAKTNVAAWLSDYNGASRNRKFLESARQRTMAFPSKVDMEDHSMSVFCEGRSYDAGTQQ